MIYIRILFQYFLCVVLIYSSSLIANPYFATTLIPLQPRGRCGFLSQLLRGQHGTPAKVLTSWVRKNPIETQCFGTCSQFAKKSFFEHLMYHKYGDVRLSIADHILSKIVGYDSQSVVFDLLKQIIDKKVHNSKNFHVNMGSLGSGGGLHLTLFSSFIPVEIVPQIVPHTEWETVKLSTLGGKKVVSLEDAIHEEARQVADNLRKGVYGDWSYVRQNYPNWAKTKGLYGMKDPLKVIEKSSQDLGRRFRLLAEQLGYTPRIDVNAPAHNFMWRGKEYNSHQFLSQIGLRNYRYHYFSRDSSTNQITQKSKEDKSLAKNEKYDNDRNILGLASNKTRHLLKAIEGRLQKVIPVLISIRQGVALNYTTVIDSSYINYDPSNESMHALVVIGVTEVNGDSAIVVQGSWGEQYGAKGLHILTEDFLDAELSEALLYYP